MQNLQVNPTSSPNSIGMIMTELPPGKFKMGRGDFAVDVTLTRPFAIGRHEVTQYQWKKVMGTEPWINSNPVAGIGTDYPAVCIPWDDANAFCLKLTALEPVSYTHLTLPTKRIV